MTEEQKAEQIARKKRAKEYFDKTYASADNVMDIELAIRCTYDKAFIDGYHECQKEHEWHDLEKDPNDLPKDNKTVLVRLKKPVTMFCYFCNSEKKFSVWDVDAKNNVQLHNVIAWCEIPQFKE